MEEVGGGQTQEDRGTIPCAWAWCRWSWVRIYMCVLMREQQPIPCSYSCALCAQKCMLYALHICVHVASGPSCPET